MSIEDRVAGNNKWSSRDATKRNLRSCFVNTAHNPACIENNIVSREKNGTPGITNLFSGTVSSSGEKCVKLRNNESDNQIALKR